MTIAATLKLLRDRLGKSQPEVCELVSRHLGRTMSQPRLSRIENGKTASPKELAALLTVYGVPRADWGAVIDGALDLDVGMPHIRGQGAV